MQILVAECDAKTCGKEEATEGHREGKQWDGACVSTSDKRMFY